ncbi:MAG: adenine-specific DNA methylase [Dehalococcoidia bacterium]|jgi:hypothetical protein
MPDKWTFKIPPIDILLKRYVGDGRGWIDPFAGENSPAEITNDINPERKTTYHLEATEFAKQLDDRKYNGILFDPPYSLEQCKRVYENIGRKFTMRDGQICGRWTELKDILSRKLIPGSLAISFGWNSEGFGIGRGFQLEEILLIAHGSGHNDTIITVERNLQERF